MNAIAERFGPSLEKAAPFLVEFFGTCFLTLEVGLVGYNLLGALGVMAVLLAMVFSGAHISGGAYNPAVVIALTLRGKLHSWVALSYIVAEYLGSFLGAGLAVWIGKEKCFYPFPTYPSNGEALAVEMVFTMVFCFVILSVATSSKTKDNQYYAVAIAFALMAAIIASGPVSGAAINPALGITLALVNGITSRIWIYLFGPCFGGVLAAILFFITNPKEFSGETLSKQEVDYARNHSRQHVQIKDTEHL